MAFPANSALIIKWLCNISDEALERGDFEYGQAADGTYKILKWDASLGLKPTEAEVIAASKNLACIAAVEAAAIPKESVDEKVTSLEARVAALEGK